MKTLFLTLLISSSFWATAQTPDSAAVVGQVDSLLAITDKLIDQKNYTKALESSALTLQLALEKLGRESESYGKACFNHAKVFAYQGNLTESEKWNNESRDIWEKIQRTDHPVYAKTLGNLAIICQNTNRFEESEKLHLEEIALKGKILGKEHPDYAKALFNTGILYHMMGKFDLAEPYYLEAKAIREKIFGKGHSEVLKITNNLTLIYLLSSQYEKAEPLIVEAIKAYEDQGNTADPTYANYINNMGVYYMQMSQYEKAKTMILKSLMLLEKSPGKASQEYSTALANLANIYFLLGNYEEAEQNYLGAYSILKGLSQEEKLREADLLNNLANLYLRLGNHEKAEQLFNETLAIQEKTAGKDHISYANTLANLGSLYFFTHHFEKAEKLLLDALSEQEKNFGNQAHYYALTLGNLSGLYLETGAYGKAEQLLWKANAITEKKLGRIHPDYADGLVNLANLKYKTEQLDSAGLFYSEAKTTIENTLGKMSLNYKAVLSGLATLSWRTGDDAATDCLMLEMATIERLLLLNGLKHLSEGEMNSFVRLFEKNLENQLSFVQSLPGRPLAVLDESYDNILFHKGLLLNSYNQMKHKIAADPALSDRYLSLKSCHRRLAAEYSKPIAERSEVPELEAEAEALEKELARDVAGYGDALRQVQWQEVQQQLKPGEAAIEFVHYKLYRPDPADSVMYAALILKPGETRPLFIPLFEEKSLDALFQQHALRRSDYVNDLYSLAASRGLPERPTLYELLWQPLEPALAGIKTIYFAPSGLLHRLNPGAIPFPQYKEGEEILADRYRLVELGSTRQLVIPSTVEIAGQDAMLFGGIQYDLDSASVEEIKAELTNGALASRNELGFIAPDSTTRGSIWRYLKWTEKEVTAIGPILNQNGLKTTVNKGYSANEESFKSIGKQGPSPRILHIATHGFFFPDVKEAGGEKVRIETEPVFKISDHPMIRSGLILAGGNHAWKTGKPIEPGMEDGILTAYEISQMNLSNTELVVLSACETGLGDIQGNEGVYGLQRAFKIAGAKYLIMSLWQVPDYQTQELMTAFYTKWLEQKMTIPDAFHAAQEEIRQRYEHPYFWAGFVLVE